MRRMGVGLIYTALAVAVTGIGAYLAVSLIVERAPEVEVPEVLGLGLSESLDALNAVGLDLEVRAFVYSDEIPENRVVRQVPAAGRIVKSGRSVRVVLSRGSERHPAPDARGLMLDDARILIEEAGLKAEVVAHLHRGPEGKVIAQGVQPGRWLHAGQTVPLAVSLGPSPVLLRVPRFDGLLLDEALTELDALGLRAARVEEVSLEDPSRQGRVVSQEPLPGFPAARGEGVILSVAGSARSAGLLRGVWITRSLPHGFARHRVEVLVVERDGQVWTFADEWLPGGDTFRRWVPLGPMETVRVLVNGEESWGPRSR